MSFLDDLTDHQKEIIVSLPYRVGLWISQSDDTGGADSSAQELQTLSNIINGFARDVFGSENMQHVMAETLSQQARWEEWGKNMRGVPADCAVAIDLVRAHGDDKDVAAFQNHLLEIGEAVAMAFSEREVQGGLDQFLLNLSFYFQNLKARLLKKKKTSMQEFLSISAKERAALGTLASALGAEY